MSAASIKRRLALGALAAALLALPAAARAAPPVIGVTAIKSATDTTATLGANVNPAGAKVFARFQYTTQADFEANGFEGPLTVSTPEIELPREVESTGKVASASRLITGVVPPVPGSFGPGQTLAKTTGFPTGAAIEKVRTEAGTELLELEISTQATATASGVTLKANGPQPVSALISGLTPGSAYRFRATAHNTKASPEEEAGPDIPFFTLAPPPTYEPCPNDPFRSGELSPFGSPGTRLPDCRSYEQATPVDKNGNNALSLPALSRAAADGSAISFGATFGIPGGEGAQALPFFLAGRGKGESGWSTTGLLPPASLGDVGLNQIGWLPDFSATYAQAERLGVGAALYELHRDGSLPTPVAPYTDFPQEATGNPAPYGFAGASANAQTVVIEAPTAVAPKDGQEPIPAAILKARNVYAWDRGSGELHLASVFNDGAAPLKGAYAGPYSWARKRLRQGGATQGTGFGYYVIEEHAVSADGSVFFTSASDGQLYQRLNPTRPQSSVDAAGNCLQSEMACTLHVSATQKTDGDGSGGADSAGPQPAAFMAASTDGKTAYFTSAEKLTDDANTGPEQLPAQIGVADLSDADPDETKNEGFLVTHATGIAADLKGEYIYWIDPSKNTIGRAKLNPDGTHGAVDDNFIDPEETSFETQPIAEPGILHSAQSVPRFVAVGPCAEGGECVYWTNRGPLAGEQILDGAGTVGRATIGADSAEDIRPEFITGLADPQGIAVSSEYIYWANGQRTTYPGEPGFRVTAGRALIDGSAVDQGFVVFDSSNGEGGLQGLAIGGNFLYAATAEEGGGGGIKRAPLSGGRGVFGFLNGEGNIRSVIAMGSVLYWTNQSKSTVETFDNDSKLRTTVLQLKAGAIGLTSNSAGRLYYSSNGENPPNPGNDLYRYEADASPPLKDLTADPVGNGAEVQGVVGASDDASYVYFVANGDLDGAGPAVREDCQFISTVVDTSGRCNLYVYHEGLATFIGRLEPSLGEEFDAEALAWGQTPLLGASNASHTVKTALVSPDGKTLVFLSHQMLTDYDNHGIAELYRYRADTHTINCASCPTSGAPPASRPTWGTSSFPQQPRAEGASALSARFLSAGGNRVYFESTETLVAGDTNGEAGCPFVGSLKRCLDVYEWEALGTGSCTESGSGWSPLNQGCIYLISTGKSDSPSLFADASESGDDAFFFTDDQLVRQDTDDLYDVYDARVGGGLVSQNPLPHQCEGDSCKPGATPPPPYVAPPDISGPPDPKPKRCTKPKKCKKKHHKKKHKHRQKAKHRSDAAR